MKKLIYWKDKYTTLENLWYTIKLITNSTEVVKGALFMGKFDDRVSIITGGAKGIGEAIVEKFFNEGSKVVIMDIDGEAARQLAQKLDPTGEKILAIGCNVADSFEVKEAYKKVIDKFDTVDILVNNAGITRDVVFHKMTEQQWDDVINVNGKGLFNCTKEAWLIMKEKKYGKVCNLSSTNSSGEVGQANYAFTKAGIIGFTKSLAREGGRHNINVNCVRPGVVDTEMLQTVPQKNVEDMINKTSFKRLGKTSEIADLIAYLCSDEASWVTGEEILVAGGYIYR